MASNPLRPLSFADFTGQEDSVRRLKIAIDSAKKRNAPLGHILMNGPAGTGKTTLAQIIANETGVGIESTVGNNIKKDIDVLNMMLRTSRKDRVNILFIDEIHTISSSAQNNLLTIMEDLKLFVRKGNSSQMYTAAPVTIIGATTNPGALLKPLYDRFDIKVVLEPYTVSELENVIKFTVSKMDTVKLITDEAAIEIAKRSRGIPRIASKFCMAAQDIAMSLDKDIIDDEVCKVTFGEILRIDGNGLSTKVDIKILKHLFTIYPSTIGVESMAQLLDEDPNHIINIVEPNLFKMGFIDRGKGGRAITPKGMAYLKEQGHITLKDVSEAAVVAVTA